MFSRKEYSSIVLLAVFLFCLGPVFSVQARLDELTVSQSGIVLSDPDYSRQWYLSQIGAPMAWETTTGSPKVIVAVIDTGVDIDHPDLKNNIWVNPGEIAGDGFDNDGNGYIDDVDGWNWVDNDPRPNLNAGFNTDAVNHGTLIAGIIAAQADNGQGIVGISWQSKIMALRAINSFGEGSTDTVAKAIDYAVAGGATVINLSFVSGKDNAALRQAIVRADEKGVLVIAAAGNEPEHQNGDNLDEMKYYPACYEEALTVAATDTLDQRASFSNYGQSCVDLSAPGVGFYGALYYNPTLVFGHFNNQRQFDKYYGGNYDGTSFAAPIAAGAAALIKSARPNLTNRQVYDLLIDNADSIDSLNPDYQGLLGGGRINIARALAALADLTGPNAAASQYFANQSKLLASILGNGQAKIYLLGQDGVINQFLIATESTTDGLFLAGGDIDLDGLDDVIVGAGPGMSPDVRVFDQSGNLKLIFSAYEDSFKGGVGVAVGDVDNDSEPEITVGQAGGGSWVKIFNRFGELETQFLPYGNDFTSGVNLAIGDIDNDRYEEIIVASRDKNQPVKVFSYNGGLKSQFVGYNHNYQGGVNIAAGDINNDGVAEIITAPMSGGGPHIRIFDYTGLLLGQFFAYKDNFYGGVSLAITDIDGDGQTEIVTAPGPTGGPHLRAFDRFGGLKLEYFAFDKEMTKGMRIASN